MKVYLVMYHPCTEIDEIDYVTISVHKTKKGAEQGIIEHQESIKKWRDEQINKGLIKYNYSKMAYNKHADWIIVTRELKP
jgi:hypothetical protein